MGSRISNLMCSEVEVVLKWQDCHMPWGISANFNTTNVAIFARNTVTNSTHFGRRVWSKVYRFFARTSEISSSIPYHSKLLCLQKNIFSCVDLTSFLFWWHQLLCILRVKRPIHCAKIVRGFVPLYQSRYNVKNDCVLGWEILRHNSSNNQKMNLTPAGELLMEAKGCLKNFNCKSDFINLELK